MRETILDGAKCLLGECCNLLNENEVEYLIVGGWSPFLFNSNGINHPGTKDVDVLFKKGFEENQLKEVIEIFLKNGFYQSAKHNFQLLREIEIKGYKFIYNMDLLHPDNQEKKSEMFVDHIDFPVKESEITMVNYKSKTILLPKSDLFFTDFYDIYTDSFDLLNGEAKQISFKLLDEAGIILSKLKSAFNEKRTRDAYDIFLAIKFNRNYLATIKKLKQIINKNVSVKESFDNLLKSKNINYLNNNITDWMSKLGLNIHNSSSIQVFKKFKKDLEI